MLSAPTSTAPAASIRSIRVASRLAGRPSRLIFDPARVASPFTWNRFFTAKGTPASGPTLWPAAIAASTARALARARSAVTSVKAFSTLLCCLIRARVASITFSAESFLAATALVICSADAAPELMAGSSGEDTGRLGFVRQFKFVDEPRQSQRHVQIGAHRRLPGVLDRQAQRLADGVDILIQRI